MCDSYFGNSSGQESAIHPCIDRDVISLCLHRAIRTYIYGIIVIFRAI